MPTYVLRIGFGLAAMGALAAWLWPDRVAAEFDEGKNIVTFVSALVVWVATEIWLPGREQRNKVNCDAEEKRLTGNDLRNSAQLLTYHRFCLRDLLKNQDLNAYFEYTYLSELHQFNYAIEESHFEFGDEYLKSEFHLVAEKLREFGSFMAANSSPDILAGREMVRVHRKKLEGDGVEEDLSLGHQANELANEAWEAFDNFVGSLKKRYPQVLDESAEPIWFYAKEAE